jgi:cytoskeleton protein RodZ
MKEYGSYLRRAREAAGLSLEDLHERTRISLKNLRLIESGDFPSIPQTYVRAFVREYARNVGLDEEDTISAYNESAEREKGIPRPPASFDSSNLLPKADDTVEFVHPLDRPPTHVEVSGVAEVESEEFTPPVRKSTYVRDGDAAAIDIRTSTHSEFESPAVPPRTPVTQHETTTTEAEPSSIIAHAAIPKPPPSPDLSVSATPPRDPGPPAAPDPPRSVNLAASPEPGGKTPRRPIPDRPPASQPPPTLDSGNEKRVIGLGLLVLVTVSYTHLTLPTIYSV